MTPQEALALAERAIRRGSCSAHKVAADGCATCEAGEEAIRALRDAVPILSCTCTGAETAWSGNPCGHACSCPLWGTRIPNRHTPDFYGFGDPRTRT